MRIQECGSPLPLKLPLYVQNRHFRFLARYNHPKVITFESFRNWFLIPPCCIVPYPWAQYQKALEQPHTLLPPPVYTQPTQAPWPPFEPQVIINPDPPTPSESSSLEHSGIWVVCPPLGGQPIITPQQQPRRDVSTRSRSQSTRRSSSRSTGPPLWSGGLSPAPRPLRPGAAHAAPAIIPDFAPGPWQGVPPIVPDFRSASTGSTEEPTIPQIHPDSPPFFIGPPGIASVIRPAMEHLGPLDSPKRTLLDKIMFRNKKEQVGSLGEP